MRQLRPLVFLALVLLVGIGKNVLGALPNETAITPPSFGDPFGTQMRVSVATDGQNYFAVWSDSRARHANAVVGSRLDRDGNPLDPQNIFIARGNIASVGVVWNGTSYTIVWRAFIGANDRLLYATRVSREGRVLDPEPRLLHSDALFPGESSLASNGSRTLIGYQDRDHANHVLLLDDRLDTLTDITLPATQEDRSVPSVAANGSNFAAIWTARANTPGAFIEGVRISSSGTLLDAAPVRLGDGSAFALASDGRDFVALSYDDGERFAFAIPASLQNPGARVLLADSDPFSELELFFAGDRYVAIGPRFRDDVFTLVAIDIDRNAHPIRVSEIHGTPTYDFGADAIDGELLVVWSRTISPHDGSQTRLYARAFSGSPLEADAAEKQVTSSALWQESPRIAFNGSSYLATWNEASGLYAARLGIDGRSRDGRGIQLTHAPFTSNSEVLWDGRQFVVSFAEVIDGQSVATIRFVSPAHGLLEDRVVGAGTPVATNGDGVTLLIANVNGRHGVRRLWGDSRTYENVFVPLLTESDRAANFHASWNGTNYLVTWDELELEPASWQFELWFSARVRGARVSGNLTVLDTTPLAIADVAGAPDSVTGIASDGTDWLVAFESEYAYVRTRRVLGNGIRAGALEGSLVAVGFGSDVTFEGTRYVLAWKSGRPFADHPHEHQWLTAGSVTRNGALAAIDTLTLTDIPTAVSITRAPVGATIAYARLDPGTGGSPRVFVRGIESIQGRRRAVR